MPPFAPPANWTSTPNMKPVEGQIPDPSRVQKVGDHLYLFRYNRIGYADKLVISAHGGRMKPDDAHQTFDLKTGQTLTYYSAHGHTTANYSLLWCAGRSGDLQAPAGQTNTETGAGVHNYRLAKCEGHHGGQKTYDYLQKMQDAMSTRGGILQPMGPIQKLAHLQANAAPAVAAVLQDATIGNFGARIVALPPLLRQDYEDAFLNKRFFVSGESAIPHFDRSFTDFDIVTVRARKDWRGNRLPFTLRELLRDLDRVHAYTNIQCSFCRD